MAERPKTVPKEAVYDASWRRWYLGERGNYGQGKEGELRYWTADGVLIGIEHWSGGLQDGSYETFYDDGSPSAKGEYEKGRFKTGMVHDRWRHPGNKKQTWRPFETTVVPEIFHAQAQMLNGSWDNEHYFDEKGVERGARGKAVDKEIAKKEKKKAPSAQDKLAALLKKD